MRLPGVNRNGNLQITQFYYGAAQPSSAAAQIAGALFYGSAQDNGGPVSDPEHHLPTATSPWNGPGGDASGVAHRPAGRRHGLPVLLALLRPAQLYRLLPVHRPRPTAAARSTATSAGPSACSRPAAACRLPTRSGRSRAVANFAVNPVNGNDVVISSSVGRIFATTEPGRDLVRHRRPGGLRQPRQLQRRPGLRCARSQRTRGRRQPRQLHLRRYRDRPDLRHPGRRRQRREQQLDQYLRRPRRLDRRVDHHRPDPRQPRRLRRHHHRRVLSSADSIPSANNPTNTPTSGSTSPATSTTWPTPSSARPTIRRPTPTRSSYNQARSRCPRSWPTGGTRSPTTPIRPEPGISTRCCTSRAQFGRVPVARRRPDLDALPQHDLRRRGGGRQSAARRRHRSRACRSATSTPTRACPTWPVRTIRRNPTADARSRPAAGRDLRAGRVRHQPGADASSPARSQSTRPAPPGTAADGTPIVTTATPTFDGLSEITGFGNATWITIVDETPGDPTFGQDHRRVRPVQGHARPGDPDHRGQLDRRLRQLRHPGHDRASPPTA